VNNKSAPVSDRCGVTGVGDDGYQDGNLTPGTMNGTIPAKNGGFQPPAVRIR
jgi:hypothetical protein